MCNHLKKGRCAGCKQRKEVFKVEEVNLDSPPALVRPNEYLLCRDCFERSMRRIIVEGAIK